MARRGGEGMKGWRHERETRVKRERRNNVEREKLSGVEHNMGGGLS